MMKIGPLRPSQVSRTLAEGCLAATVDGARQLLTSFGLRPYRVFLVWVGWSADEDEDGMIQGAERQLDPGVEGVGRAILLKEIEILPTPKVDGLGGVGGTVESTGTSEAGALTVSEISVGYTEDALQGLLAEFRRPGFPDALKPGVTFFWEIQENRPRGFRVPGTAAYAQLPPADQRSTRRRFHLSTVPARSPDRFEWRCQLTRADGERSRGGNVEAVAGAEPDDDCT